MRIDIPSIHLLWLFVLISLLACTDTPPKNQDNAASSKPAQTGITKTFVFECDADYHFVAQITDDSIWLFLPSQTVNLPLVRSASGAKFSDGSTTFWSKGEEATLEISGESVRTCSNNRAKAIWEDAKLRGVDFRAIGQEPGWLLEIIAGETILFVGNYGQDRYEFPLPKPVTQEETRITTYTTHNKDHTLVVKLKGRTCHDTMSGEPFETTVTVTLDTTTYHGCGKPLH